MEKAFSLIKHRLIGADFAQYRQNLDEQIVCPTCYEQVFKKKLWVLSKQSHTHFFSHYFGDQDSCDERTKGEGGYENSKDKNAQLQRLEEFNKVFRENITAALVSAIGKQASKKISSALEFAVRMCTDAIENKNLGALEINLINSLDEPITSSIDDKLENLEEAILPIYWHLKSPHGQSNLRFIACTALLMSFHEENEHLENILEKRFLKSKPNINALLLGNAVLLLANSEYVNWSGSTRPIINFLKPPLKKEGIKKKVGERKKNKSPKESSGYFACIHCKKIYLFEYNNYKECNACHRWFYTHPTYKLNKPEEIDDVVDELSLNETAPIKIDKSARWHYCISCKKQYQSDKMTPCPHISNSENLTKKKIAVNELTRCPKCRANYINHDIGCPYCTKNTSDKIRYCRGCGKGLIKSALLPSKTGQTWRKCNFCSLNFEYKNF